MQAVLAAYDGTILLVSHDRFLIDALATQIWEIKPGKLDVIDGDYQAYLRWRNRALPGASEQKKTPERRGKQPAAYREKIHGLNPFEAAKHTAALEDKIEQLETNLSEISLQLDDASLAGDSGTVRQLGLAYSQTEAELEAALEEWGKFVG